MILALVLLPAASGLLAWRIRRDRPRRALLVGAAAAHAGMAARVAAAGAGPCPISGWSLDGPGILFLGIASTLFLAASVYAVGYLVREERGRRRDHEESLFFSNAPEAVFTACLLESLAAMTLVCVSHDFGWLWVGIEATTLATAPLIYFHRHHRSLEATWKYLLVCSVGIALALLGNFVLAVAAGHGAGGRTPLVLGDLLRGARGLDASWLRAAFLFLLVGYGTKMGLAPLHKWLPDAHSEAPSVVSSLLSGAVLNAGFLGILRACQVCEAAGQGEFAREILRCFGLLSMAVAAVFILGQTDYKRLLAYSSVEHVGILALGVGVGGAAAYGAMLHAVNHSLVKAMLFLVAGNILAAYHTKSVSGVVGAGRRLPVSGFLWVAGFLAITGSPPFGPFLSEFTILKGALEEGRPWLAGAYLALLGAIFVGMATPVLRMAQGTPPASVPPRREPLLAWGPPAFLCALALLLGVYVPPPLERFLREIADRSLRGWP